MRTKFHEDGSGIQKWRGGGEHKQVGDRMSLLEEGRPNHSLLENNSKFDYLYSSSAYCNDVIKNTIKTEASMVKIKGCSQWPFHYPVQDWCKGNSRAQFIAEAPAYFPVLNYTSFDDIRHSALYFLRFLKGCPFPAPALNKRFDFSVLRNVSV